MTETENQQNEPNKSKKKISCVVWFIGFLLLCVGFAICIHYNFFSHRKSGTYTHCQSNLKNIGTALEMYSTDHKENFPENLNLIAGNYIRSIPTCSEAEKDTYSATYQVYNNSKKKIHRFTFYCGGHYHDKVGLPENYPQYTSEKGLISR